MDRIFFAMFTNIFVFMRLITSYAISNSIDDAMQSSGPTYYHYLLALLNRFIPAGYAVTRLVIMFLSDVLMGGRQVTPVVMLIKVADLQGSLEIYVWLLILSAQIV
jgi:hypothetical protein